MKSDEKSGPVIRDNVSDMKPEIKPVTTSFEDGLVNLAANLGTSCDKNSMGSYVNTKMLGLANAEHELNAMYRTNWVAGKVVDIIPDDMTREWRDFGGDLPPEVIDALVEEENRLRLPEIVNRAHKLSRLFGTSFIVMSVDDGQLPEMPLDISKIKPGGLRHIHAVDRYRIHTEGSVVNEDPLSKNFGMPEFYRFSQTGVRIHHSRVLRFDAIELPFHEFQRNNYFSDPVLARVYSAITNFDTATDSSASLIYESNIDVFKIKNFMQMLQNPETQELLHKRFALASSMKSINNALLLDGDEDYQVKNKTFSGLPDLIDRFASILASATDIPATRFLGSSASGLNATGEGDLKNYYDMIRSKQVNEYKPMLDYFDKIMAASLGLSEEADMFYEFNSLFQMSPIDKAALELSNANRDAVYLDRSVISEAAIAKQLVEDGVYTNIEDQDIKDLEEFNTLGEPDDINTETDPSGDDTSDIDETS